MRPDGIPDVRTLDGPPFFAVLGWLIEQAADGTSSGSASPHQWLDELTAAGTPATALAIADAGLGTSIASVANGKMPVTASLHIDFLADLPTGALTITSRVTDRQHDVSLVTGTIEADGRTIGLATLRAMLINARAARPAGPPEPPSAGTPAAPCGIGAQTGVLATGLARACVAVVTGADDRSVTVSLVPAPELGRNLGVIHGGAVAAIGALGIAVARERFLGEGTRWRQLDARVDFLRGISLGQPVEVRATARHVGRRLALFDAEILEAGGRLAATTRETVLIQD